MSTYLLIRLSAVKRWNNSLKTRVATLVPPEEDQSLQKNWGVRSGSLLCGRMGLSRKVSIHPILEWRGVNDRGLRGNQRDDHKKKSGMRQTKNYGWTLTLITALLSCGSSGKRRPAQPLSLPGGKRSGEWWANVRLRNPASRRKVTRRNRLPMRSSWEKVTLRRNLKLRVNPPRRLPPSSDSAGGGGGGGAGGGGSFMEWKDRLSAREVLDQKGIQTMERGWKTLPETQEVEQREVKAFSSRNVLEVGWERLGQDCAAPDCSDQVAGMLESFGFSEGAVGADGIQTGNWVMEMGPDIPVEERIRLLDAALQTGPVLLETSAGFGWYAGSSTPGGKLGR